MILRWLPLSAWIALLALSNDDSNLALAANATGDSASSRVDDAFLWGPYKPNLYFGVRSRLPKGLTTGLLWANVEDYRSIQGNFRYTCEQSEGMAGYGWEEYDVRTGGRQTIHDAGNKIDIKTEFVRIPGGDHGGSWATRITGSMREDAPKNLKTSVVFYAAMEGLDELLADGSTETYLVTANPHDPLGYEGSIFLRGRTDGLGEFQLEVTTGPETNSHPSSPHPSYSERPLDRTMARSGRVPEEHIWQAKSIFMETMKLSIDEYVKQYGKDALPPPWQAFTMPNDMIGQGNMHLVQKVFEGSFEFDIIYTSASRGSPVTSEDVTSGIVSNGKTFGARYSDVLGPQAPFTDKKYDSFSKSMFSNLLGGIGYFHGDSVIDRSYASEYDEDNEGFWEDAAEARSRNKAKLEGPYELFTAIPSRTFFPRGFLWDEGFHLLPIIDWDTDLALEILLSWFKLMDQDGWIAREQILGPEARSKVPQEFQVQYPHYANPPTLFLVLEVLLDKLGSDGLPSEKKAAYSDSLRTLYPLLKRHYFWYRRTQSGDLKTYDREAFSTKEGYRWRGRTPSHILTSGLDDYPRAQPPHPGELHVDLMSWMGLMTRSLRRIATALDEMEDSAEFSRYETAITRNLDDLHWDEKAQTYCDSTIDEWEESSHVCHKGYISLFPFMTGMLPSDSPRIAAALDLISDPNELWSDHGIRSLSKSDPLYRTSENYWRSPVWMNMNYLIVDNLLKVAQSKGSPHAKQATDIYMRLRKNLVDTVYKSWEETGFAWEQYDPESGAGQRTQHFTGWTSLIVKILCMPDLSHGTPEHGEL